jgi:LysM repeat protein
MRLASTIKLTGKKGWCNVEISKGRTRRKEAMRSKGLQRLVCGFIVTCLVIIVSIGPALAQDEVHVVQPGENLFRIALRYGVDVDMLAQANGISNSWQIYAGQTLVIPVGSVMSQPAPPETAPDTSLPAAPAVPAATGPAVYHTVARGEHLVNIANAYGVTEEQLAQLNNITNPNMIYAGQELLISPGAPVDASVPPPAVPDTSAQVAPVQESAPAQVAPETTYTVQPGEHLASIAARYGVSWLAIAQANNISDPNHVEAGQQLIIPAVDANGIVDYGIVSAPAAPAAAIPSGRSIVVDLSDSRVYAYEDGALVRNVLVSTGLPGSPTVIGDFNIYVKYTAQLMTGPGYYLPDVPYVMYFYQGYGLHGTYWHNNFGHPMSHGCVNLPTPEAEWFYGWADVGTPVHVQY